MRCLIVAAHQPNYLPWLGFFDKMQSSDVFIIEDSLLVENRGFFNRNRIKGSHGPLWLTVPREHAGKIPINEVRIAHEGNLDWRRQHWLSIKYSYCRAPHWAEYSSFFEEAYGREWIKLVDLNMHFIAGIRCFLGIETPLVFASTLKSSGLKSDLIIAQCEEVGATAYLSGVGARDYLEVKKFEEHGIRVVFQDFQHPVYAQLRGDFVPNLSAIDYLFCEGGKLGGNRSGILLSGS